MVNRTGNSFIHVDQVEDRRWKNNTTAWVARVNGGHFVRVLPLNHQKHPLKPHLSSNSFDLRSLCLAHMEVNISGMLPTSYVRVTGAFNHMVYSNKFYSIIYCVQSPCGLIVIMCNPD